VSFNAPLTDAKMASITQTLAFSVLKTTELKAKMLCPFTYVISKYGYIKFHSKQKFSCHRLLAKFDDLASNSSYTMSKTKKKCQDSQESRDWNSVHTEYNFTALPLNQPVRACVTH
jgi:hypothetical protein